MQGPRSWYLVLLPCLLLTPGPRWANAAAWVNLDTPEAAILDLSDPHRLPDRPASSHLYRLPVAAAFSPYGHSADTWLGPHRFDYEELDRRLAALVELDPAARVLLRVDFDSPPWWEQQNRETLVPSPRSLPPLMAERKPTHASWYSPTWRQAARQALQSLVKHVETGPWAECVFGYELDSGRGGRWVPWHQAVELQETSPAAQAAFRAWLQRKYGGLAALRVAWGQPRQPLADSPEVKAGYIYTQWAQIQIPSLKYMLDPASPGIYDPSGQQHLADYQLFLGEYTAEVILDLVRAGREAGGSGKQWGACYGHLLWWPEGDWPPSLAGHLGLSKLLAADEINFLVGPPGAPATPTGAAQSIELRGKRYLEQVEQSVGTAGDTSAPTVWLRRSGPSLRTAPWLGRPESSPGSAPWALVLDERSLAHLSPGGDLQRVTLQTQALEIAGLAWPEVWLAGDLPAARSDCLGYVLAATYYVPDALREAVIRRARPGTVVVWLYAAGTLDGGFIDPSGIFRLTGLRVTMLNSAGSLRIEIPPGEPLLTPEADRPLLWGPLRPAQPRFVLLAGDENFGTLAGSTWPGMGLRWDRGALLVYCVAPGIPGPVLQRLAAEAQRRAGGL